MPYALVIEDDQPTRILIRRLLEKADFKIEEAEDGMEGLQVLKKRKFDVILLDLNMPKMDGEQVLSVLKKRNESLPVIVFSAYLTKERIIKLAKLGVKEFLPKPFDLRGLYQAVDRVYSIKTDQN